MISPLFLLGSTKIVRGLCNLIANYFSGFIYLFICKNIVSSINKSTDYYSYIKEINCMVLLNNYDLLKGKKKYNIILTGLLLLLYKIIYYTQGGALNPLLSLFISVL